MYKFSVVVPDVKLTYRRLVGKIPGIYVIRFERFFFNPLEIFADWMDPNYFPSFFAKIFTRSNLLSIPSENLIATAVQRLFKERGVFADSKNFPIMSDLHDIISKIQLEKTLGYRYRDVSEACLNRISGCCSLTNFSCRQGINIDVFTQSGKIIILELPLTKISDSTHNWIVSWLVNLIYHKHMVLGLRGNLLRVLILIDEASTILSAGRESGSLDFIEPGLNQIIVKGREFGVGLALCSQQADSFTQVFKSNSFLKIAFPLTSGNDRDEIKQDFGLNDEQGAYFYKLPPKRVSVCRFGNFERPFLLETPAITGLDHVPDDQEIDEAMKDFYAEILPKEDKEISVHNEEPYHRLSNSEIDAILMVRHLITVPFLNYKELINVLHLTPARGDQARAWLINSGYAKPHSIVLRRGKPGDYYELTEKAYKQFGGRPPIGHGSFRHKLFCFAIKTYMEDQGWGARVEGIMQGTTAKAIDVLAWKKGEGMIGYEVTLHFPNLIHNLNEDLRTTLKKVVVVCANKDELAKAQKIVRESSVPTDRLEFKTIFDFTQK